MIVAVGLLDLQPSPQPASTPLHEVQQPESSQYMQGNWPQLAVHVVAAPAVLAAPAAVGAAVGADVNDVESAREKRDALALPSLRKYEIVPSVSPTAKSRSPSPSRSTRAGALRPLGAVHAKLVSTVYAPSVPQSLDAPAAPINTVTAPLLSPRTTSGTPSPLRSPTAGRDSPPFAAASAAIGAKGDELPIVDATASAASASASDVYVNFSPANGTRTKRSLSTISIVLESKSILLLPTFSYLQQEAVGVTRRRGK